MHLCCVVKKQRTIWFNKFRSAGSLLLLLLFLSIPLISAFHYHHAVVEYEKSGDDEHISSIVDSCKLCDYFAHKQGKELHLSCPPQLVVPIPEPVTLNNPVIALNYKFTLQGFTNKGPPAFVA